MGHFQREWVRRFTYLVLFKAFQVWRCNLQKRGHRLAVVEAVSPPGGCKVGEQASRKLLTGRGRVGTSR